LEQTGAGNAKRVEQQLIFVERIGALEAVDSQAVVVLADGIDNKKILNPKALLFRFGIYCVYLSAKTSYRI
jgi:hypothetical protein